ncbi:hypothetical protein ATO6_01555 [Oceanicola sp. 22II-s10i]|uniref:SH3 domain-containing protein n=1 Tax=Oceanicola sp. 22II-s10i TaxID=1317116 RepID=UPI000B5214E8|nr:SH3 domain-containing protein [Oceanicola sp. 22II-s10i]OWU85643.1 hypothetical protein ATO6_01555 [Oceanicola sp. 22II-s10i]
MNVTVRTAWTASYPDPVSVASGDPLTLSGRSDDWEGHRWLWARDPQGREGWVPDSLVSSDGLANFDYSAMELSCFPGDGLQVLDRTHGWTLCRNARGQTGWVPDSHLILPGS